MTPSALTPAPALGSLSGIIDEVEMSDEAMYSMALRPSIHSAKAIPTISRRAPVLLAPAPKAVLLPSWHGLDLGSVEMDDDAMMSLSEAKAPAAAPKPTAPGPSLSALPPAGEEVDLSFGDPEHGSDADEPCTSSEGGDDAPFVVMDDLEEELEEMAEPLKAELAELSMVGFGISHLPPLPPTDAPPPEEAPSPSDPALHCPAPEAAAPSAPAPPSGGVTLSPVIILHLLKQTGSDTPVNCLVVSRTQARHNCYLGMLK